MEFGTIGTVLPAKPPIFPAYSTVLAVGHHDGWFLGNSITAGNGGTSNAGFRPEVTAWMTGSPNNWDVSFTGTTNGPLGLHDGHPGYDLAAIRQVVAVNYTLHQHIGAVHFIIVMGGANDMNTVTAYDPIATPAKYASLLEDLAVWSGVRLVVSNVTPHQSPVAMAAINDFNAKLPAIHDSWDYRRPANRLIRCDSFNALGGAWSSGLFADPVHPNPAGYTLLANERIRAMSSPA